MECLPAVYGCIRQPPIYWLVSMVTVDKHYRIRRTHYSTELSIPALFGRRRVTHEPPECVPYWVPVDIVGRRLAAGYPNGMRP